APSQGGVPIPFPNENAVPAIVAAIAASAPPPPLGAEPEPGEEPADECADCSRVVVLEGVQKVALPQAGKSERETAFAFRLGADAFEGIDPLGQLYTGSWSARDARGAKLRLHLGPEAGDSIDALLAASAEDLGVEPSAIHQTGPAKIELRLAKGGLVGKVVVRFEAEIDGRIRRGSYVAKLRSQDL
ncbi:MAG TPA: hypothetical protein VHQ66_04300, partial [Myxococcota bacterium]|nr:hypothetical protein [Myxococcota bacterium]